MGNGQNLSFTSDIAIQNGTQKHWQALAWAVENLRRAGSHRWRGFGSVRCKLLPPKSQQENWKRAKQQAMQLATPEGQKSEAAKEAAKEDKDAKRAKFLAKQQAAQGKQKSKKKKRR